jgi:deazaflavin-dependent oxidoreductase (nitroreductase family)
MAVDYNTAIIEEFRASNGKLSGQLENSRLVLVNTTGAKSGKVHTVPLAYLKEGDRIFIVGSAGGSDRHPAWYYNLLANPEVSYELGGVPVPARARLLEGDERMDAWTRIVAALPFFGDYAEKVSREIPVFVLEPR